MASQLELCRQAIEEVRREGRVKERELRQLLRLAAKVMDQGNDKQLGEARIVLEGYLKHGRIIVPTLLMRTWVTAAMDELDI